ncbi:hypothetical protein [Pedobacter sp. MW01-1-1]|uniref:hypothetical protein n=1 Tax=Pedobacter sp. MW01-1-1 TaxID=3383027 RepID=UPI003FEFBC25
MLSKTTIFLSAVLCVLISSLHVIAQEKIKVKMISTKIALENGKSTMILSVVTDGNMSRDTLAFSDKMGQDFSDGGSGNASVGIDFLPCYKLKNKKTGESWSLYVDGKYKIAQKTKLPPVIVELHRKDSIRIDSITKYAEIDYQYLKEFKKISGFNCQKVLKVDKRTGVVDSMYVSKELNFLREPNPVKPYKTDYVVQFFWVRDGLTHVNTIVSAKEDWVPADYFDIPKDYIKFNTRKEYIEWHKEQNKGKNAVTTYNYNEYE